MNNDEQKDQNIIELLSEQKEIQPSEALLSAALTKISQQSSMKNGGFLWNLSYFQKATASTFAIILLVASGVFYRQYRLASVPLPASATAPAANDGAIEVSTTAGNNSSAISPDDISDAAFDREMKEIDDEMDALDSDSANADQALNSPSS